MTSQADRSWMLMGLGVAVFPVLIISPLAYNFLTTTDCWTFPLEAEMVMQGRGRRSSEWMHCCAPKVGRARGAVDRHANGRDSLARAVFLAISRAMGRHLLQWANRSRRNRAVHNCAIVMTGLGKSGGRQQYFAAGFKPPLPLPPARLSVPAAGRRVSYTRRPTGPG